MVAMRKRKSPTRAKKANAELSGADAKRQLDSFLAKYSPEVAGFARRALDRMRKLVPGAIEFVYDNYNWLVIGFGPSERPSEAIFSIVLPPNAVTLREKQRLSPRAAPRRRPLRVMIAESSYPEDFYGRRLGGDSMAAP